MERERQRQRKTKGDLQGKRKLRFKGPEAAGLMLFPGAAA